MEELFKYQGTDWLGFIMGFVSTHLLGQGRKLGFLVGLIGNASWIAFGFLSQSYASIAANIVFICLNLRAWQKWKVENACHC
ncbi:MAG: nicotinamide mononucleotide transporter [Verrucomicrobiota bacterium]|nr:nicotinamide mononucleotide transporter [Verrucomicrobiota bacterium]